MDQGARPGDIRMVLYEASGRPLPSIHYEDTDDDDDNESSFTVMENPSEESPRALLIKGFCRGQREMASSFTKHFPPLEQYQWWEQALTNIDANELETLPDQSVIVTKPTDAFRALTEHPLLIQDDSIVSLSTNTKIVGVKVDATGGFALTMVTNMGASHEEQKVQSVSHDAVILATGNSCQGLSLAKSLGHSVKPATRSLFGLNLMANDLKEDSDDHGPMITALPTILETIQHKMASERVETTMRWTIPYGRVRFKYNIP